MHHKYSSGEFYPARVPYVSELNLNLQQLNLFSAVMLMQAHVRQRATSARVPQRQHLNFMVHSELFTLTLCTNFMAIRARQHSSTEKVISLFLPHANRPRRPACSVFKKRFSGFSKLRLPCRLPACCAAQ